MILGARPRKIYKCNFVFSHSGQVCGEAFARSDHLTTHKKIHLDKGKREYPCRFFNKNRNEACEYRGATKSDINRHHKTHEKAGDLELPEGHAQRNVSGPGRAKTRGINKENQIVLSDSMSDSGKNTGSTTENSSPGNSSPMISPKPNTKLKKNKKSGTTRFKRASI